MKRVEYLLEASEEIRGALLWYEQREPGLGARFGEELLQAEDFVSRNCAAGVRYIRGTRKWPLHVFPYTIIYIEESERIVIVAVAHGSREPGYWLRRL